MADLIIGERRGEMRHAPGEGVDPQIPGVRMLEVVDVSRHGLRCRLAGAVRPGRPMSLRWRTRSGSTLAIGLVVRCHVSRVTRQSVVYEAAWQSSRPWPAEY